MKDAKHYIDGVLSSCAWVNGILVSATSLSAVIVVLKLTGKTAFEWLGIEFHTDFAWIVLGALTIAHGYATWVLLRALVDAFEYVPFEERVNAFDRLSATGGLFFRGMLPRLNYVADKVKPIVKLDLTDPSLWLTVGATIVSLLAVVPFHGLTLMRFMCYGIIAGALVFANWRIGTFWARALAESTSCPPHFARLLMTLRMNMRNRRDKAISSGAEPNAELSHPPVPPDGPASDGESSPPGG